MLPCGVSSPPASATYALAGTRKEGNGGTRAKDERDGDGRVRVGGGGGGGATVRVGSRNWRTAGAAGRPHVSDGWRRPSKAGAVRRRRATRLTVPRRAARPAKFWPRRVGSCRVKIWRRLSPIFGTGACAPTRRVERARSRALRWSVPAAAAARSSCRWLPARWQTRSSVYCESQLGPSEGGGGGGVPDQYRTGPVFRRKFP